MINFRYLDSAYIELSSDISFVPKLGSLEGKRQSQRQSREKIAIPIYDVYRYILNILPPRTNSDEAKEAC